MAPQCSGWLSRNAGATAVAEGLCPVRWDGAQAVVVFPEHIGISNSGQVREQLLALINRGATTLIADMTATISCDHAGVDAVARAYQRALISGTELRLVVTAQIVSRVFSLRGLDRQVSIYPSLEAATAATTPAAVLTLAAATVPAQSPAAAVPDGDEAPAALAVVGELLDALRDGVALADSAGMIVRANRRLEEMLGYDYGELRDLPVESLLPAGLQAAHRSHRTVPPQPTGQRKDGTTFPVQVTISPVTAATGHFTFIVMSDGTGPGDHQHRELLDTVITGIFHAGLSLQTTADRSPDLTRQRIEAALGHLDDTIRQIQDTAFTARSHHSPPRPAPARRSGNPLPGAPAAPGSCPRP